MPRKEPVDPTITLITSGNKRIELPNSIAVSGFAREETVAVAALTGNKSVICKTKHLSIKTFIWIANSRMRNVLQSLAQSLLRTHNSEASGDSSPSPRIPTSQLLTTHTRTAPNI
ncbi:hypothetical protein F2P81_015765 [Scophthalmus maximus]|uniref:Uncharacterized protein n=1 Tax=Scophthalmus maximus TaxID=52904 RepID=A0A6A4SH52_SCOMX|nr:hypothetical protein F2P81_015765 [Scophthalmus maximus]